MVKGNTGTITMRLVRSKLRIRDEPCTDSAQITELKEHLVIADDHQLPKTLKETEINSTPNINNAINDNHHVTFVRTSGLTGEVGHADVTNISEWTFPPKAPSPHIYHLNPDMLVANEKISFKGFRKQFSGRFKRLVARKLEPVPVIPPELKPQLKTIYVY